MFDPNALDNLTQQSPADPPDPAPAPAPEPVLDPSDAPSDLSSADISCPLCGSPVTDPDPSPEFDRYCHACGHRTPAGAPSEKSSHEDVS